MYKLVVLGGGSGAFSLLRGLKRIPNCKITSVFTIADDGGSSGVLRSEFGILPPGDFRRHLAALSESSEDLVWLLNSHRFSKDSSIGDHSFGNLLYTALVEKTGSDEGAVHAMNQLFETGGNKVLPVSLDHVTLIAQYHNGTVLRGESQIDTLGHNNHGSIIGVHLEPHAQAYPQTLEAIAGATHVVLSPGDLYTSIVPILLVDGIPEAIKASNAKVVYVSNLMTKQGETDGFGVADFVSVLRRYLHGASVDGVIANNKMPSASFIEGYKREGAHVVGMSHRLLRDLHVPNVIETDLLFEGSILRHDSGKTCTAFMDYLGAS